MLSHKTTENARGESGIAALFDSMVDEYDEIEDIWYSWLFSRLHFLIAKEVQRWYAEGAVKCLDVGCGTGFQTILLSLCGFRAVGIDIARKLLRRAAQKDPRTFANKDLFTSPFKFSAQYSQRIREISAAVRSSRPIGDASFQLASATRLPFPNNAFDIVSCCGSTLSFIEDYRLALREMSRVLRPGGIFFLEVENKYNADLLWPLIDTALRGKLGYRQNLSISMRNLTSGRHEHVKTEFPFSMHTRDVMMPLWLFSPNKLIIEAGITGLRTEKVFGIHSVTNLLPSVALDSVSPPRWLQKSFSALATVEELVSAIRPFSRLGCSLVCVGSKQQ